MKKLLVGAAVIATLSLGACSSTPSKSSMSYEETVAEAKAQYEVAKKAGNVWKQKKMKKPYVEHYLAKAEDAKKKGDESGAMKWANEALKSAKAAVAQTTDSAGLKPGWIK